MKGPSLMKQFISNTAIRRQLTKSTQIKNDSGRALSTAVHVKPEKRSDPQKTALYDLHVMYRGKMVDFAGYYLPIQYDDASIGSSHSHTRSNCSIFDVSHMLQTNIYGKHAVEFLESLCVTDILGMKVNQSTLSLFVKDSNGGIIDDLIITKISDQFLYLVSNASRQNADKALLLDKLDSFIADGKDVSIEFLDSSSQSLVAVQGPKTAQVLQPFVNVNLENLYFMNSVSAQVCGIENCRITRCGYTGEDGVEISVPSKHATEIVETLLRNEFVKLAGLGARDTLRLEAGLCLYGNDIDEETTPVEAGLTWTIGKRRKEEKNFPGSDIILEQLQNGVDKKRVGIMKPGGPPARSGTKIIGFDDNCIGYVTSGCPSPSLGVNIAIGYVQTSYAKPETDIRLKIRETLHNASIAKMPFGSVKYYMKPKKK